MLFSRKNLPTPEELVLRMRLMSEPPILAIFSSRLYLANRTLSRRPALKIFKLSENLALTTPSVEVPSLFLILLLLEKYIYQQYSGAYTSKN